MRKEIYLLLLTFSFYLVLISCKTKTPDDELAERMAKSENFKAIMNFWKEQAKPLIKLPDSTKNKFRLIKVHLDSLQKNNNLTTREKGDSILKIVRSQPILKKLSDSQTIRTLAPAYKNFSAEFPELRKLPKDERTAVFQKAAAIWVKNSKK
jgi:hypothetical protein